MQFVGKVISSVSEFYRDINPATLSGAIDVVVVENVETGELACSPFHVRFGKLQLLRPQEKAVELRINGIAVGEELRMKVGEAGETFFVLPKEELGWGGGSDLPLEYLTSPLVGPETPAPIESIEEFKLEKKGAASGASGRENTELTLSSPEWKWKWGDLPMKKESTADEVSADSTVSVNVSLNSPTSTVGTATAVSAMDNATTVSATDNAATLPHTNDAMPLLPTVELYEYLAQKDYLLKLYETLARLPARSMITRIYRVDRGLHFNPITLWPECLISPAFLNESARLLESDFLLNPNVVIEESSRLVYQFTWENRKVVLGGSVGAAVVFYAQTYARILPLEIVLKLAEIATIRMAKRKFSKSVATMEGEEEAGDLTGAEISRESEPVAILSAVNPSIDVASAQNSQANPHGSNGKSSWRSWWSRSNANSSNSSDIGPENLPSKPSPILLANSLGSSSPTKLTAKTDPPSSLSSLIDLESPGAIVGYNTSSASGNTANSNNSNSISSSVSNETLTKRIVQRTASIGNVLVNSNSGQIEIATGSLNNISALPMISSPSSSILSVSLSSPAGPIRRPANPSQQYIKSLRLPSHLLKRLNLKQGVNTISYTVNTRLQGTATCQSRIFLWRSDTRVVISDIDGTITKSDALGHLFTMVGKDWTHVGVAQLYSKIAANGYEFLYLTSRAIGQAASTRGYLKGVEQDRLQLPDGPVIMSPDRLFTALHREVIQRRPDEFKIACLRDIQKLFINDEQEVSMMGSGMISSSEDEYSGPSARKSATNGDNTLRLPRSNQSAQCSQSSQSPGLSSISSSTIASTVTIHQNPFYAGFGNRPTDTKSYKAVGISASRIFLINPAGDLKLDTLTFYTPYSASSYSKLTEEVDKVFPPVRSPSSLTRVAGDEAFTDFQYWHGLGGDVRMDLVQMALGSLIQPKRKVDALIDEYGKPVSPRQLGAEGTSTSTTNNSTSSLFYSSSEYASTGELLPSPAKSVATPPALPPRRRSETGADYANDAEDEDEEDDEGEEEVIDSFPFI